MAEADAALRDMLLDDKFGEGKVVVEDYLEGSEFSFMCFVSGRRVWPMVLAQDHKRAYDGDCGPNTGGMGAYSPLPFVTAQDEKFALERIMQPVADAMAAEGCPFEGVLYGGLMKTAQGIKVIEFNARFGDPETEVVLPRLKSDIVDIFCAVAEGRDARLEWHGFATLGIVLASKGYPGAYEKGHEIGGLDAVGGTVYHMGTKADGDRVLLVANIGNPDDATGAIEHDAEGVGLFRSEFLFMDAKELPSEEDQFKAYQKVALKMKDQPVIIRTLDVGGDKEIPYLDLKKEENPFMGYRAVRYCLSNPEQYKVQLRALLRASAFGDIKIMVPLVTCLEEIRSVKELVEECKKELDAEGVKYNPDIEVGTMIETPAASLIADDLAAECDFFSIGTNDLIGYTMCADRGNDAIAYLYSVYNPAVLRSIKRIVECGNEAGIMVGMCGEAAADPLLIPMLISFGLGEYSVSAPSVLKTRKTISEWTKAEADALAEKVMRLKTAEEVKDALAEAAK